MNNDNNYEADFVMGSAAAAKHVSENAMAMCCDMDMYPPNGFMEVPPYGEDLIIASEETETMGNDATLWELNANKEIEEKEFLDLDSQSELEPFPDCGLFEDEKMEFIDFPNEKQEFYQTSFIQQTEVVAHHVTFEEQLYVQNTFSPMSDTCYGPSTLLSPIDSSFPPSPTSSINSFRSYEPINNNMNDMHVPRTRKASFKAGKSCKIGQEKMPRTRRTKAEMEIMTKEEKTSVKQEQNRINAKNCVARKNGEKAELAQFLPVLKMTLEQLEEKNRIQQNGLLKAYSVSVYPAYDNNAPYGHPDQFRDSIEDEKRDANQEIVDNNGQVLDLQKSMNEARAKLDEALHHPAKTIKPATLASQKSRAKSSWELATLKYKTAKVKMDIKLEKTIWNTLANVAETLNKYLKEQNKKELPAYSVDINDEQFEPS